MLCAERRVSLFNSAMASFFGVGCGCLSSEREMAIEVAGARWLALLWNRSVDSS